MPFEGPNKDESSISKDYNSFPAKRSFKNIRDNDHIKKSRWVYKTITECFETDKTQVNSKTSSKASLKAKESSLYQTPGKTKINFLKPKECGSMMINDN